MKTCHFLKKSFHSAASTLALNSVKKCLRNSLDHFSLKPASKEGWKKKEKPSAVTCARISLPVYWCARIFQPQKEQAVILHLDSKWWSCAAVQPGRAVCLQTLPPGSLQAPWNRTMNVGLLHPVYALSFQITLCMGLSLRYLITSSNLTASSNDLSDTAWEALTGPISMKQVWLFLCEESSKVPRHRKGWSGPAF